MANLADLVGRAASRDPGRAALIAGDDVLSWAELDARIDRAAAAFAGLGLARGDRVAVQLGNVVDFPVTFFGALRAGLVVVPANTGYTEPELTTLIDDSGARLLVTSSVATIGFAQGLGIDHLVVAAPSAPDGARTLTELLAAAPPDPPTASGGDDDLAVLVYTSGTSGRPRGAMLTHRALLANLDQCAQITPSVLRPGEVVLLVLPMFHIYGLGPGLGMLAHAGATAVLVDRFDAAATLDVMTRHHVTNVVGAPPMYVAWARHDDPRTVTAAFADVRLALSGAAPLSAPTLERLEQLTSVVVQEGYGLTETAPVLTSTLMSEVRKPLSVGRAIPGVTLELRDEQGGPVEEDDPGEIIVRGPNLFSGYWPDGHGGPTEDGWFATGDVAYPDDDGDLYLVGRRKDLIIVSGFNVYPAEIELVLMRHPAVSEAAVVATPHEYTGEAVKAFVVRLPGATLDADDVRAWCARSLARFKCPTQVQFVDQLPHSVAGKVRTAALRDTEDNAEDNAEDRAS
jgi:long-chain acyl-CoA synthetase